MSGGFVPGGRFLPGWVEQYHIYPVRDPDTGEIRCHQPGMLTHGEEGSYEWVGHGVDVPVRATARERRAIIDAMETAIIEDIELHGDSPS